MARAELHFASLEANDEELAELHSILDNAERLRASQFRFATHRRRFITRRGRLRHVLGSRIGIAPGKLEFDQGPFGKPLARGWRGHFSASHSGETMLVALCDVEVGCDIEAERAELDWRPLAERFFAPAEIAALDSIEVDADARTAFFRCWSRKEAFVKAIGQGLSYPLDSFDVSVDEPANLLAGGEGWTAASIPMPGIASAVVAASDNSPLSVVVSQE